MRDSFINRLTQMAATDSRVMLITGDLGFGVMDNFRQRFPTQFLNVGVAEQNMIGVATGLALEGYTVFTYSIANFAFMRCLEQIRNDAAYHECNVNVVSIGGGFSYGALGVSHHATEDLAIMRSLPQVTVVAPADCWEAAEATAALATTPGVGYLRLDKTSAPIMRTPEEQFHLGKARCVRDGRDVTLAATGGIVAEALAAADMLSAAGIDCRVLSIHTISPLDEETLLRCAIETGRIVTIEEHAVTGGLGGAVAETLADAQAQCEFRRIGLPKRFSTIVGSQEYLRSQFGLDSFAIRDAVLELACGKPSCGVNRAAA